MPPEKIEIVNDPVVVLPTLMPPCAAEIVPELVMPPKKFETELISIPEPPEDAIVPALVMPPRKVETPKPVVPIRMPATPPEIRPVALLTMPPPDVPPENIATLVILMP